jgi:hypothetical protein
MKRLKPERLLRSEAELNLTFLKTTSTSHKGMFLNVLRRQANGEWKMSHICGMTQWRGIEAAGGAKTVLSETRSWNQSQIHGHRPVPMPYESKTSCRVTTPSS